jgi:hypothetical protein
MSLTVTIIVARADGAEETFRSIIDGRAANPRRLLP